jgi:hypothetical protein
MFNTYCTVLYYELVRKLQVSCSQYEYKNTFFVKYISQRNQSIRKSTIHYINMTKIDFIDDPQCGTGIFYQHGMCRYYLTPRQFEQLNWREEIVRRRRLADAIENDEEDNDRLDSNRCRKQRRNGTGITNLVQGNPAVIKTEEAKSIRNDNVTKPSIKKQRKYRIKDEDDERKIHRSIAPVFYQIFKGPGGRMQRLPVTGHKRPCKTYAASNRVLPFVLEDDRFSSSSSSL